MKLTLVAIGKLKGTYAELCAEYAKRVTLPLVIKELVARDQKAEGQAIMAALPVKAIVVLLDEHGTDLTSRAFADKLTGWLESGASDLVFVIGGADGLTQEVRDRGDYVLGLGQKTWPHKLARVMLLEQLYRAQQINSGHPYHRD